MVLEASEADSDAGLPSRGTMLSSAVPADSEAATNASPTAEPMVDDSRVASPSCAEETAADEDTLLTSLPAELLAEEPEEGSPACSLPDADNDCDGCVPLVDSSSAYQPPPSTHPAQPEDGGAVRSTAEKHTRVLLPRAVAWEVPASGPSLAASHAVQLPRQTPAGQGRPVGVSHAPPSQVSASQPAAEGVHMPPVQRDAATSPVRDVLLPHDYADR